MPRESYVFRDGAMVPKHLAGPRPRGPVSALPRPYIIGDSLGGVNGMLNHADGRVYDSRSRYLQAVKDAGCEVVGNDAIGAERPAYDKGDLKSDLRRAVSELSA